MKYHKSLAEAIEFTRARLAAFRHVLATRDQRLASMEAEKAVIDDRIGAFLRSIQEAPTAIQRLEAELERLSNQNALRLAVHGSSRYTPSKAESLIRQRDRLLRRLAEVEASLPPELRGGDQ